MYPECFPAFACNKQRVYIFSTPDTILYVIRLINHIFKPKQFNDMWIFGYGSLIWDDWERKFEGEKVENAILTGFSRAFNKKSVERWGSRENPGPTLGLEKSNQSKCIGCAFEIPEENKERVITYLNEREGRSFQLTNVKVELPDGTIITALTPINDPERNTYIKNKDIKELAKMARKAEGTGGKCVDYVKNIHEKLQEMNIHDKAVENLWEELSK